MLNLRDWVVKQRILTSDMQGHTDRLRSVTPLTFSGNVQTQGGAQNGTHVHIPEPSPDVGRAVMVYARNPISDSVGSPPYPAGEGGFYYGWIVKDFGLDSVESFVGDYYTSSGTTKPGSGTYINGIGGGEYSVAKGYNLSNYDCIVANLDEFGVTQSKAMLNGSLDGYLEQGNLWFGVVVGQTRADDSRPSLPIVYVKGAAHWPCAVNLTSAYTDTDLGSTQQPGFYKAKMVNGTIVPNEASNIYGFGRYDSNSSFENTLAINIPERQFSAPTYTPWFDTSDTTALPLVVGHRVGYVQRNGSAVDGFHLVYFSDLGIQHGGHTTVADLTGTPSTTDMRDKINAILGILRTSKLIPT